MPDTPARPSPSVTTARLDRHAKIISLFEKAGFWSALGLATSNYTLPPTTVEAARSSVSLAFWVTIAFASAIVMTLVPLAIDAMRYGFDKGTAATELDGQPTPETPR